jgi:tetratricopeptide (TPR) repeat protein
VAIEQNDHGLAAVILHRLAESKPTAEVLNNLGSSYVSIQMIPEGEQYFRRAVKIDPKCRPAWNNLALCKVHQGEFQLAEQYATKALECAKELYATGKWDRSTVHEWDTLETLGYAQLAQKNFADGWKNYNQMVGHSKSRPWKPLGKEPRLTQEEWEKSRGQGKQLYLRGEQGIGDEIHFSSILEQASKDFTILMDADEALQPLLQRSFPYVEIWPFRKGGERKYGRDYKPDYHCLIGDLAQFYRTKEEDFPGTAFLTADPELKDMWKARLAHYPGLKVGFTFTGGIRRTYKIRRTMPITDYLPMFDLPYVTSVCLGWEADTAEELDAYVAKKDTGRVVYFEETMTQHGQKNYDHIAALVDCLDVIVSVPQSIVHVAGALGKETYCLCPETSRWFYHQTRRDEPNKLLWYPNVRLFRQTKGKWPVADFLKVLEAKHA